MASCSTTRRRGSWLSLIRLCPSRTRLRSACGWSSMNSPGSTLAQALEGRHDANLDAQALEQSVCSRSLRSVPRRIRETCICETPSSAAISVCVRSPKKRRASATRSRADSDASAGAIVAYSSARCSAASSSPIRESGALSSRGHRARSSGVRQPPQAHRARPES